MAYELHESDPYKIMPVTQIVVRALGLPKVVVVRRVSA